MSALPLFDIDTHVINAAEHGSRLPAKRPKAKRPKTLREAAVRRDEAIEAGLAHADRVKAEWRKWAYDYMKGLIAIHSVSQFLAEDLIERSEQEAVWTPSPDKRAWGGIFRALARDKIIAKVGYAAARTSNLSPHVLWGRVEISSEAVIVNKP